MYVHDLKSKGRAATRRKAAPRGLSGPGGGVFTRNQLIPGRVPLARLHRGAADAEWARASERASERQGGRGRASRAVCALPTSQEVPGNIPSGPPLPASPAAAAAAKSGQAPGRCSPLSAALPGQGSCRLLLLLLLLLAESGLGEKPGPPPPWLAWRAGAARAGLGGRADAGGALPAGAPGPGGGGQIQRSSPHRASRNIN